MTGITMFDTALNNQFPADAAAYAAYVDGGVGNQPNYAYIVATFPQAQHLSIALSASDNADVLDVEDGAASPQDIPGWHARQVARGIQRPVIYASVSAMNTSILGVLSEARIALASRRLWTAHYGLGEHICGPGSCGALCVDADGTQWTPNANGLVLDQSLLAADFFGPPPNWVFSAPRGLAAVTGPHSVRLTWNSPGPTAPLAVDHYQVTFRKDGEDLSGFPVNITKGPNPESHQWDDMESGTYDEAMVRAMAKGGTHASPWAEVSFPD